MSDGQGASRPAIDSLKHAPVFIWRLFSECNLFAQHAAKASGLLRFSVHDPVNDVMLMRLGSTLLSPGTAIRSWCTQLLESYS